MLSECWGSNRNDVEVLIEYKYLLILHGVYKGCINVTNGYHELLACPSWILPLCLTVFTVFQLRLGLTCASRWLYNAFPATVLRFARNGYIFVTDCRGGQGLLMLSAAELVRFFDVRLLSTRTFTVFFCSIYTTIKFKSSEAKTELTTLFGGVLPIKGLY